MRFTDALSTTSRSALVTSSQRVTQSTATQKERRYPKKESPRLSNPTLTSHSQNVLCYTEEGGINSPTKSSRYWLI